MVVDSVHVVLRARVHFPRSTGDVCMEIFGPWSPAVTMKDMLGKVAALFQEANTESPINAEAAALYTGDKCVTLLAFFVFVSICAPFLLL